jgi:hypothetical protein
VGALPAVVAPPKEVLMLAPFIPRIPGDAFGREPRGYDDLRRLAARYASDELAGRTLANHATQLAITLTPEALAAATRPGAPAALLRAIAELPSLLAHALYVRTVADRQRRPEVRRLQLLGATAEVAGRRVKLLFVVRENFNGRCFLDRVIERGASARGRQDGGEAPDANSASTSDNAHAEPIADADSAGSETVAPAQKRYLADASSQATPGRLNEPQFDKVDSFLLTPGGPGATGQFQNTLHYDLDSGQYYPGVVISNEDRGLVGSYTRTFNEGTPGSNPVQVELQMTVQTPAGTRQYRRVIDDSLPVGGYSYVPWMR